MILLGKSWTLLCSLSYYLLLNASLKHTARMLYYRMYARTSRSAYKSTLFLGSQKNVQNSRPAYKSTALYTVFQVMWLMLLTASHAMQQCEKSAYIATRLTADHSKAILLLIWYPFIHCFLKWLKCRLCWASSGSMLYACLQEAVSVFSSHMLVSLIRHTDTQPLNYYTASPILRTYTVRHKKNPLGLLAVFSKMAGNFNA